MTRQVAALVLAVVAVVVTGCSGGQDQVPGRDAEYRWRQTHEAMVSVSAGRPATFMTSPRDAFPPDTTAWRSVVRITNNGDHAFPVHWLQAVAVSGGRVQQEVIDPFSGCDGLSSAQPVMPGESTAVIGCWTGGDEPLSLRITSPVLGTAVTFSD